MTRTRTAMRVLALAFALALFALPATAFAAGPTDIWQSVGVSVHDLETGKTPTLVIVAQARAGLTPPVEAAIPIPKGAELSWAGEMLGGDPSDDPILEVTIEEGETYDLARFSLVNSPRVQLELTVPAEMLTRTETRAIIDLSWTSAGPIGNAGLAVYVPADAHMENVSPTPLVEAVPGQGVLYSIEASPVVEGQTLTLSGVVLGGLAPEMEQAMASEGSTDSTQPLTTPAEETPPVDASGQGSSFDWRWLLGALALVLAGVGGYLAWKYQRSLSM